MGGTWIVLTVRCRPCRSGTGSPRSRRWGGSRRSLGGRLELDPRVSTGGPRHRDIVRELEQKGKEGRHQNFSVWSTYILYVLNKRQGDGQNIKTKMFFFVIFDLSSTLQEQDEILSRVSDPGPLGASSHCLGPQVPIPPTHLWSSPGPKTGAPTLGHRAPGVVRDTRNVCGRDQGPDTSLHPGRGTCPPV